MIFGITLNTLSLSVPRSRLYSKNPRLFIKSTRVIVRLILDRSTLRSWWTPRLAPTAHTIEADDPEWRNVQTKATTMQNVWVFNLQTQPGDLIQIRFRGAWASIRLLTERDYQR